MSEPSTSPAPRLAGSPDLSQRAESADQTRDDSVIRRTLDSFNTRQRALLRWTITMLVILLACEWAWLVTRKPDPLIVNRGEQFQSQFRVDVNSATWVEWIQLEGIGPALAHRIVADRKLNGPFASIDDLNRVPGIGPLKLDQMRRWLTIRHDTVVPTATDADGGVAARR